MYLLVHPNSRVSIKDDTRIRMTTEEAEEWKNGISKSAIYETYNNLTQFYFKCSV